MDRETYIDELLAEDELLRQVRARTTEHGLPAISIRPAYGRLLTILAQSRGARDALEIGALGGYSAICIARGLPEDGRLVSLEIKADRAHFAEENTRAAGLASRVEFRVGEAHTTLDALREEERHFDFFFIDADKESYPAYLESCLRLARPGALLVADNAFYRDRVLDAANGTPAARALREFNREFMSDPRLTAVILPAFDGLALAMVNR